jgi:hypothetical protein
VKEKRCNHLFRRMQPGAASSDRIIDEDYLEPRITIRDEADICFPTHQECLC